MVKLPFTPQESREYRMVSLGKSYREFETDGAGFFFHFDPRNGYGSLPSGFSTSYNTIPHTSYVHILEYGFTGRQINAAYIMASEKKGKWIERGKKVVDFFLNHCLTENGWLYSLYDLNTKAPFYSCGDPDAPKLHYISRKNEKGNYLRTMTEPMNDVLDCYEFYKSLGKVYPDWLEAAKRFGSFLIRVQNDDGSFYRAYQPNGTMADVGGDERLSETDRQEGRKAATAIPIVFLCHLCKVLKQEQQDTSIYESLVEKAGNYTLEHSVKKEHYQGGTLDNPNVVDKEASQYVMAGLYHLYVATGKIKYLVGAAKAARIFVTWNYIWNAPTQSGTILAEKHFRTKGCGAINSTWGGGVVDIYSLFHIKELYQIGVITNDSFLGEMAEWIAVGTEQILSCPQDDMDFADLGMQPEGFGICPQGVDDGQIDKGDIWGTLGWIYSAGIYGLGSYLNITNK